MSNGPLKKATKEEQEKTDLELLQADAARKQADRENPVLPYDPVQEKGFLEILKEKIFGPDDTGRTSTVGDEAGMMGGKQTYVGESQDSKDFIQDQIDFSKGTDMSTSNVADGSQNIGNTGASSNTGGARYSLIDPVSIKTKPTITKSNLPIIPTAENMAETGKEVSEARMKAAERSTSKNRFGLFGNYGKDVEIRKVRDASTGLISRQKFVDGKRVRSGRERRASRRAFRRFK
tara:strand:+ start:156 stop:857 length:702 start_codon:yes stop_codon:yes gene_type:complete